MSVHPISFKKLGTCIQFSTDVNACFLQVPLPVLKSLSDCTDGPLEVKNGDDIIVIQGGYALIIVYIHC